VRHWSLAAPSRCEAGLIGDDPSRLQAPFRMKIKV